MNKYTIDLGLYLDIIFSSNQSIADDKHFLILYHLKNISYQDKMSTALKSNRKSIIFTENRSSTHTQLENMHKQIIEFHHKEKIIIMNIKACTNTKCTIKGKF